MVKRIGRSAESHFETFCVEYGATCNRSTDDQHGWDHIVEFPRKPREQLPLDLEPPETTALVQVKGISGKNVRCQLKLSNALRFAKHPLPCFVVLMAFSQDSALKIYAVHFWKDLITRTLKRVREADRDGRDDLHRLKLIISFKDEDEVGSNAISWIENTINYFGSEYTSKKNDLTNNIGFDDGNIQGEMTLGSIDQLVDFNLGLIDSLSVDHLILQSQRFGISARKPLFEGKPSGVRMQLKDIERGSVRLRSVNGDRMVLDADILTPGIPGLDSEHLKMRFRTSILDLVWAKHGQTSVKFNFDPRARHPIEQIEQFVKLKCWGAEGPVEAQVWVNNQRTLGVTLNVDPGGDRKQLMEFERVATTLRQVAGSVTLSGPSISAEDIEASGDTLGSFIKFLTNPHFSVTVEDEVFYEGAIGYCYVTIGSWTFMVVIKRQLVEEVVDGHSRRLIFGAADWLEHYALRADAGCNLSTLQSDYERHVERCDNILLLGNFFERL